MPLNFPFTAIQMTEAIARMPSTYGVMEALNAFPVQDGVSTIVEIRFRNGKIEVLTAKDRGAPPAADTPDEEDLVLMKVPHFPHLTTLTPKDIQDMVTLANSALRPRTMAEEMAKKLERIKLKHDITKEYVRLGALKGVILDGAGATLHNLFTTFGVTKKQVGFVLGTATTDIIAKIEEIHAHVRDNLKGETMTGVELWCSPVFFNKFVQHAKVEKYYLSHQAALALADPARAAIGGTMSRSFPFQNLMIREYPGAFPIKSGNTWSSVAAFPDDKAYIRVVGTTDTYATYTAPPDSIEMANMVGEEIYITDNVLPHEKGIELASQSNLLAVTRRPELIVEVLEGAVQ